MCLFALLYVFEVTWLSCSVVFSTFFVQFVTVNCYDSLTTTAPAVCMESPQLDMSHFVVQFAVLVEIDVDSTAKSDFSFPPFVVHFCVFVQTLRSGLLVQ